MLPGIHRWTLRVVLFLSFGMPLLGLALFILVGVVGDGYVDMSGGGPGCNYKGALHGPCVFLIETSMLAMVFLIYTPLWVAGGLVVEGVRHGLRVLNASDDKVEPPAQ